MRSNLWQVDREPDFPLTVRDASVLAAWYVRYALDMVETEPELHVAFAPFLKGARTQLDALEKLYALRRQQESPQNPGNVYTPSDR